MLWTNDPAVLEEFVARVEYGVAELGRYIGRTSLSRCDPEVLRALEHRLAAAADAASRTADTVAERARIADEVCARPAPPDPAVVLDAAFFGLVRGRQRRRPLIDWERG